MLRHQTFVDFCLSDGSSIDEDFLNVCFMNHPDALTFILQMDDEYKCLDSPEMINKILKKDPKWNSKQYKKSSEDSIVSLLGT